MTIKISTRVKPDARTMGAARNRHAAFTVLTRGWGLLLPSTRRQIPDVQPTLVDLPGWERLPLMNYDPLQAPGEVTNGTERR
jgi:hypothetical protein